MAGGAPASQVAGQAHQKSAASCSASWSCSPARELAGVLSGDLILAGRGAPPRQACTHTQFGTQAQGTVAGVLVHKGTSASSCIQVLRSFARSH